MHACAEYKRLREEGQQKQHLLDTYMRTEAELQGRLLACSYAT